MTGLSTGSYGEGTMSTSDQRTTHQTLIERVNLAADNAMLEMDAADRTAADGGTAEMSNLRAYVTDLVSAAHGFESLIKAGVTPENETPVKDDRPAAKPSGTTASGSSSSSGSGTSKS